MSGANIAYSQWSRMWLFEAFFTAFRSVLSDSDETRIAPLAICVPLAKIYPSRTPLPIEVIDFRYVA